MSNEHGSPSMATQPAQLVDLTPAAAARARELLANHGDEAAGIRLGVKTTGCSGMSYKLDFAREIADGDTVVEQDGVKLVVEPGAVMYLLGTQIDWVEDKLGAMFVFKNPNEKARCGCGESFSV
jgi:iron-sulfur cluster assembly protein